MKDLIVTGAFGLVGSAIVKKLNERGIIPKVIDHWDNPDKWRNTKDLFFKLIKNENVVRGSTIIHAAASVNTKEAISQNLWDNNVEWTLSLRECAGKFIYTSSMSVYGNNSDMTEGSSVNPLCPYALTKSHVDKILLTAPTKHTYALRLSNVYGPREQHKGDMASLVTKGLLKTAPLYLAKGHHVNGLGTAEKTRWQLFSHPSKKAIKRDFLYSEDIAQVVLHFLDHDSIPSGIYNLGHGGEPRSFEELVTAVENLPIQYVPLPDSLKNQYQHYTAANITKLREVAGYQGDFTSLEDGIEKTRVWMKQEGLIL